MDRILGTVPAMQRNRLPIIQRAALMMLLAAAGTTTLAQEAQPPSTAPARQKPAENAAVYYRRAVKLLPADADIGGLTDLDMNDPDAARRLAALRPAVEELHHAASVSFCDWDPERKSDVPAAINSLNELRMLAGAGVTWARWRWRERDPVGAWATLGDVMSMSRHLRGGRLLVNALVGDSLEETVCSDAAIHLLEDPIKPVEEYMDRLDHLSPATTLADNTTAECQYALAELKASIAKEVDHTDLSKLTPSQKEAAAIWLDPKRRDLAFAQIDQMGRELAETMAMPPSQWEKADAQFLEKYKGDEPADIFAKVLQPVLATYRQARVAGDIRLAMFRAAVAIRDGGEARLQTVLDPSDGKPFAYRKTEGGFELASTFIYVKEPVRMQFGKPEPEKRGL